MEDVPATVVLYTPPLRSHLVPMVELAKLLLPRHFSITVLLPSSPYPSPDTVSYLATAAAAAPSIRFHHLPPVPLPADFPKPNNPAYQFDLVRLNNPNLRHTLVSFSPAPAALVLDFFCNSAFQVGMELRIPTYYLFVSGAGALATMLSLANIERKFTQGLKGIDVYVEIPGLPPVRSKDMPVSYSDPSLRAYSCFTETSKQIAKSEGIIVNTFDSFEPRTVRAIREGKCVTDGPTPRLFCIGPLFNSRGSQPGVGTGDRHRSLSWLDSQPSRSVIFLSFGSMGFIFSAEQLEEIAVGLERSGVRFLWVARAPNTTGSDHKRDVEAFLPSEFLESTRDRGLVVDSWAPQVEILNHDSVGGFVTHCGWNSVLEAVAAGVPMLAWPLYAEQTINKVSLVEEIGVALPVTRSEGGLVSATELEKRVAELMDSDSDGGKEIRERVTALKYAAAEAMSEGGSSLAAVAEFAQSLRLT